MIRLPVSIGEALDKLTILDIKVQKIQNPTKRAFCQQEYDILHEELQSYVEKHGFYYTLLRNVNLSIWEMQDDIRERPNPQKCVDILDKNDMRFRIKDIINYSVNSYLREQKGYQKRRALIIGHLGLGDHIGMIGAVRYIAMQHDETVLVCKKQNAENVRAFFADNPTITLWTVDGMYIYGEWPMHNERGEIVRYDMSEWTNIYRSGFYKSPNAGFEDLPRPFYVDMGIDPEVRHTYFYIPTSDNAKSLYEKVREQSYIFVQQKSSSHLTKLVTWDTNEILTIDPNVNMYPKEHMWYSLAQACVDQPFLDYIELIKHANEIHTVDSSFYCISCYLPLEAQVKRCYARETGAFIPTYTFN